MVLEVEKSNEERSSSQQLDSTPNLPNNSIDLRNIDVENNIGNTPSAETIVPEKDIAPPYSILKNYEKLIICIDLSMIAFWSAVAAPIYYPALPILEDYFHEGESVINLSIVAYLIFQGLAPSFTSSIADYFGRRNTMLACMLCFIGVCIGISQIKVFWLLVFLRCLQAATIAPVVAVAGGVIGDITQRHERGSYLGAVFGITAVAQGFGSVIGAALTSSLGWRSIFYFLAIASFVVFLITFIILPETKRGMVGNLSILPEWRGNIAPILLLPRYSKRLTNDTESLPLTTSQQKKFDILGPFKILLVKEVFFTLMPAAIQYTAWCMTLTTLSLNLASDYGYSVMHVGWCYLAPGLASLIGSITAGRVIDWYYKRNKAAHEKKYESLAKEDRPAFNLYHARLGVCYIPSFISGLGLIMFAWVLDKKVHIAAVLVSNALISYFSMYYMTAVSTIIVDMYPERSASGTACVNLARCLFAGLGVGVLSKMTSAMTVGGCYTFWGAMVMLCNIPVLIISSQYTKKIELEAKSKQAEQAGANE